VAKVPNYSWPCGAWPGTHHQGVTMGTAMKVLAIVGILAALYVGYRYGVY